MNRQRVVSRNGLPHIIRCLQDVSLIDVAVPVLFNICTDFGQVHRRPCLLQFADNLKNPHSKWPQQISSVRLWSIFSGIEQLLEVPHSVIYAACWILLWNNVCFLLFVLDGLKLNN